MADLWLDPVSAACRKQAVTAIETGDVRLFLMSASNEHSLDLVWRNVDTLKGRGLYERALLCAFTATRTNNRGWSLDALRLLFRIADRDVIRAIGDPLPGPGPFTIYRGVAGNGSARRVRGVSWTGDIKRARFFARRYPSLASPAVFQVTVDDSDVMAYSNEREEQEFIVLLSQTCRPVRVEQLTRRKGS